MKGFWVFVQLYEGPYGIPLIPSARLQSELLAHDQRLQDARQRKAVGMERAKAELEGLDLGNVSWMIHPRVRGFPTTSGFLSGSTLRAN